MFSVRDVLFVVLVLLRCGGDHAAMIDGAGDEDSLGTVGYIMEVLADAGVMGENSEEDDMSEAGVIGDLKAVFVVEVDDVVLLVLLRVCFLLLSTAGRNGVGAATARAGEVCSLGADAVRGAGGSGRSGGGNVGGLKRIGDSVLRALNDLRGGLVEETFVLSLISWGFCTTLSSLGLTALRSLLDRGATVPSTASDITVSSLSMGVLSTGVPVS